MAAEFIDDTPNGTGQYPTKIPGYEDAADIQEALRLYHYGSTIIPTEGNLGTPNGINTKSVAGYLKALSNTDAANAATAASNLATEVTNRTNADTNLQNQINSLSSTLGLQTSIVTKTSSFTLELADASKTILLNTSSTMNLTIPSNSAVAIPVGYRYSVVEMGSGVTTFVPASGVTINSKNSQLFIDTQYGQVTLLKVAENSWIAYGDIYEGVSTPTPTPTPVPVPTPTPVPVPTPTPFVPTPVPTTPTPVPTTPTPVPTTPTPVPTTPTPVPTTPTPVPTTPTPVPTTPTPSPTPTTGTVYITYCYQGTPTSDTFVVDENNVVTTDINSACSAYASVIAGLPNGGGTNYACSIVSMPAMPTNCTSTPTPTPTATTTYYWCCNDGSGSSVSGGTEAQALSLANSNCSGSAGGINGGIYTSPQSCTPTTPTPTPTPTTPTPVPTTPTPSPTPTSGGPYCRNEVKIVPQSQCVSYEGNFTVCYSDPAYTNQTSSTFVSCVGTTPTPTPTTPTPVPTTPTPVPTTPTPVPTTPTPTPTPTPLDCSNANQLNQSQCAECGYTWQGGQCLDNPAPPSFPYFAPPSFPYFAPVPPSFPVEPTPPSFPVEPTPPSFPVEPTPPSFPVEPTPPSFPVSPDFPPFFPYFTAPGAV
jgi:hypothetical protein